VGISGVDNNDKATPTATDSTGEIFDSKVLAEGQSLSMTYNKHGTYTYKCLIDNYQTGTIVVW
jgi:plastocyanin